MNMAINEDERAFWLALHRTKGLGPVGQKKLIDAFPSVKQIFSADAHTLKTIGLNEKSITSIGKPDWKSIEADLAWLDKPGHHLVTIGSSEYPTLLGEISDPPIILFTHGSLEILKSIKLELWAAGIQMQLARRLRMNLPES